MAKISDKYQRDYRRDVFNNPRLEKKLAERRQLRQKVFLALGAALFLGIIYFLFYSPYFCVVSVEITGLRRLNQEKFTAVVEEYRYSRRGLIFSNNNFWIFSRSKLSSRIGANYLLENVSVKKHWPNRITVVVKEKEARIAWYTGDKCFGLDELGRVIEICEGGLSDFIKIRDLNSGHQEIGSQAITSEKINFLFTARDLLQDNKLAADVFNINFESVDSIKVELAANWDVYLSYALPIETQVRRLVTIVNDSTLKGDLIAARYIDLRFGEKVYFK